VPAIHPHVLKLAQDLGCNVFIESGTYYGTTYRRTVESGYFERVYSVEIVEQLYRNARKLYDENGPYRVFLGKSHAVFVSNIFPQCGPNDRIFFWLDGHYSRGVTGGAERPCPLLDELIAIRDACPTQSVVIAIDDTDDFGRQDANTPGLIWPSRDDVERIAFQINSSFVVLDYTGKDSNLSKIYRGVLIFAFRKSSAVWRSTHVSSATAEASRQSAGSGRSMMRCLAFASTIKLIKQIVERSDVSSFLTHAPKLLSKALARVGKASLQISRKLYQSPQQRWLVSWRKVQGDKTLRLNYDLDANSLVFDLGGYEGQWASDISSMYCCTIHVFEPVIEFADRVEQRFSRNEKVHVHKFGLSNGNRILPISVNRDGSSLYTLGNDVRDARLVRAIDFMQENCIERIDLMKINIEGGEYDLLNHLIDTGFVKNIVNIQVQFHDLVPNAEQRMAMIQKELEKTHSLTYQYRFVWENWRLK